MFGDFNAQTANLVDYTENYDFINNYFDLNEDAEYFINQKDVLVSSGINQQRMSMDKKLNNHGYKLIEICKKIYIYC